jgi:iron complex outermembrane receptor protein
MPRAIHGRNSLTVIVALFASVAVVTPFAAMAQQTTTRMERRVQAYAFDIPAKSMASAISDVGAVSGWRIAYAFALPRSAGGAALSGTMTPIEAVSRLLAGTGICYRVVGQNSIVLIAPSMPKTTGSTGATVLETITVNGEGETALGPVKGLVAHQSASSTKTATSLLETPQSVSVVTADQISQQATQSVGETVRYTPGTRGDIFGVSTSRDYIRVRGFSPNYYQDGLILPYGITAQGGQSQPYGMERVEVLRGPSSVLFGQNPPGGIINMVSKRPRDEAQHEVFLPGRLLRPLAGRVRQHRPDDATSLPLLGQIQRDRAGISEQYFPLLGTLYKNPNGEISSSTNLGEPDKDRQRRDQNSIGYDFSHEFDNGLTFRQNARYTNIDAYNATTFTLGLLPDNRTISRAYSLINRDLSYFTIDNQVLASFDTGAVSHEFIAGLDYKDSTEDALNGSADAPDLDLFDPVYGKPLGELVHDQDYSETNRQVGIYAQDQIRFDKWRLTLSGRHDWTKTGYDDRMGDVSTEVDHRALTGRIGLNYVFDNDLAPYASYSTSFEPVLGATSAERGSQPFEPTEGRQFEVGLKYQPTAFDGLFSVAFFDLTQTNVLTTDPDNIQYQVQTGEVEARGFEFEARANLTEALSLIAVYTFLKEQRLLESRRLIEGGAMNVTKATIAVGYSNPSHFSQLYLRRFGMQSSRALAS